MSKDRKKQSKFGGLVLILLGVEALVCVFFDCLYFFSVRESAGRLYRVEAERVAAELADRSVESIDLSKYDTIVGIDVFQPDLNCDHDYVVKEAEGVLYRIEYVRRENAWTPVICINVVMGIMFMMTVFVLFYIWKKILKPFQTISELPAELAKGNLTMPVREEKNRYFGRFLWGMDMLREHLETARQKELEMQKEKRTLLLSLSHDIKTPLSAIELYAKALSARLYDTEEKRSEALQGITRNAGDIHRYLDEIIRVSREDFLNLEVQAGEFYLSEVMRELEGYYRDKLSVLHIAFVTDRFSDCLLKGDRERVTEILQNLMENAVKYGDGERIRISYDDEEDCRLIRVENTGCTLKSEELPHLTDPFYRGSNSGKVPGSGLGLYICRDLIRKMDGDIFVSVDGVIFRVTVVVRKA